MTSLFRPQLVSVKWKFRQRRLGGPWAGSLNYRSRIKWYPASWTAHQQQFARRFGQLHYLACHAPAPVQQRWSAAYRLFERRHFPVQGCVSMRYLNTYSCQSWL